MFPKLWDRNDGNTDIFPALDITSLQLFRNLCDLHSTLADMPSADKRYNYILLPKVTYKEFLKGFCNQKKIIIFKPFYFIFGHRNKMHLPSMGFSTPLTFINTYIMY